MTNNFSNSIVLNVDSYKSSMFKQYPPGTEVVYSYVESRGGADSVTNLGLQTFIKDVLMKQVTKEEVEYAAEFWAAHGEPFPKEEWMYIVEEYEGRLPLSIRGLDEGLNVPTGTPVATIYNTDPKCFWLTTWVETAMLRAIWYPSTVATRSLAIQKVIKEYLKKSGDVAGLPFKLHDFGARGASSYETAMLGGMAHLATGAMGTDNVTGIFGAEKWYDADPKATGYSIPAAEHSTVTSWGRENEVKAYSNMIDQFSKPGSIYAVVSDSYDIFNATEQLWGNELRDKVVSSGGTLVIRPDSGDPVVVLPRLFLAIQQSFGTTKNDKGYKVLNNVRFLWGDGIDLMSIQSILRTLVDVMGFSADNIAFGTGGNLLQKMDRDTFKFAMKASAAKINGQWVPVLKEPITDSGKKSKSGKFSISYNFDVMSYLSDDVRYAPQDDMLRLRFFNGVNFNLTDFEEIRARTKL